MTNYDNFLTKRNEFAKFLGVENLYDYIDHFSLFAGQHTIGNKLYTYELLKESSKVQGDIAEFDADVKQFRKKGCIHLGAPQSSKAFAGKRVVFFLTPLRMVIELIEAYKYDRK